jgi:hypothetical protein
VVRTPITQVSGQIKSNLEDRDSIIALLLKRMCTFEEAVEYLLSAVLDQTKDDMLGELSTWDGKLREMKRIRDEQQK